MVELPPEFSIFWEYFPKKKSKGDAYKAWVQTASQRPDLASILKAVVVLKNSADWLRDDGQYIPYPATFLRAWGWADVLETEKADVRGDAMWWKRVSGVEAKAKEFNLSWDAINGETYLQFTARVRLIAEEDKISKIKVVA